MGIEAFYSNQYRCISRIPVISHYMFFAETARNALPLFASCHIASPIRFFRSSLFLLEKASVMQ